jgi:hypothetical protein
MACPLWSGEFKCFFYYYESTVSWGVAKFTYFWDTLCNSMTLLFGRVQGDKGLRRKKNKVFMPHILISRRK